MKTRDWICSLLAAMLLLAAWLMVSAMRRQGEVASDLEQRKRLRLPKREYGEMRDAPRGATGAERLQAARDRIILENEMPEILLVDHEGRVSAQGLEALGEQEHQVQITAAVEKARLAMAQVIASAARRKTRLESPRHLIYWIPAQPEAGAKILKQLKADFTRISGAEKAAKLSEAFDACRQFGNFGQRNIRVDFVLVKIAGYAEFNGSDQESYTCYDAESGVAAEVGVLNLNGYPARKQFGEVFGADGTLRK